MNNLVSVIIPSYNHEKYVQDTIKSIIMQTYKNIELIIVDDGSTDSTFQKIEEMKDECEKRFQHFYFETKQNEGTIATLNKLFSLAKGEYIYLIASDDMIADVDALKIQAEFLDENPNYALVVGDNKIIDSNNNRCFWLDDERNITYNENKAKYKTFVEFLSKNNNNFNNENFGTYKSLRPHNYIPNGYLIRKSIYDKIIPFSIEAPLEDWFLMLQLSKYGKFKFFDKILFSYRWHAANTIKDSKKIYHLSVKTCNYERQLVKNNDFSMLVPNINEINEIGLIKRTIGIKNFFEILIYKIPSIKTIIIRIFNIQIYKKTKLKININYIKNIALF